MKQAADDCGARLVLVVPAANLRNCRPFKSELEGPIHQEAVSTRMQAARASLDQGRFELAREQILKLLQLEPRFAEAHYVLGRIQLGLGEQAQARRSFERARDEDICPLRAPESVVEVIREFARAEQVPAFDFEQYLTTNSESGIPGDDWFLDHVHPTIEGHDRIALELIDVLESNGVVDRSDSWNEQTRLAARAEFLARLTDADHATAMTNLSKVMAWAGKEEIADAAALRAYEYRTDDPATLYQAGNAFCRQRDFKTAHDCFMKAARLAPRYSEPHYGLGLIALERRDDLAAVRHFREAVESQPDFIDAHYNLANAALRLGDTQAAITHFRRVIELSPKDVEAINNLGLAYLENGQFHQAVSELENALRLAPRFALARRNLERARQEAKSTAAP